MALEHDTQVLAKQILEDLKAGIGSFISLFCMGSRQNEI